MSIYCVNVNVCLNDFACINHLIVNSVAIFHKSCLIQILLNVLCLTYSLLFSRWGQREENLGHVSLKNKMY